ncbi:hypothetical protein P153DRAFT_369963 [Dothidotthia symphoricarpi CBS 119687]|uniref:Uncharacterized protein n=1 Tax=Dothidotthia symphoricarpi CBS 119687 TaxID=1392245 RepID=A0A6A6A187_9PLEO|nr:uncharacterized protein P153DRAFT_369963 [Dothidotthia symphoricarpi CBS 119687]KAF2125276.1 hypothetical protein P153DRAFT_369963 [Dothidotthia symphoricarpi CBS 119687]
MVLHGLLPKPIPADLITVGQLLTHPLHPERDCFLSDIAQEEVEDLNDYHIQLRYRDIFSIDTEGRFMTNYGHKFDLGRIYRQPNLLTVKAEQMIQRTSQSPSQAFQAVCNDPEARQWIYDTAKEGKELYIVLGVTELKDAVFKRAKLHDAGASKRLNESPIEQGANIPTPLRSTLGGLGSEPNISGIFGMDVRRVMARVTTPAEPHSLTDIDYRWVYYDVPDSAHKEQLMVGLGKQLKADELRLMLDLSEEVVQGNLNVISQLSLDALSAAASPMLRPSSPALRGRSPSPHPAMLRS